VNPDEVVAVGAALQAGVLRGDRKDVLLIDVTPHSLGIETKGGIMTRLIERNTAYPHQAVRDLLHRRGQTAVRAHSGLPGRARVRPGQQAARTFELTGIAPAPRGLPQIEVTFDIDANASSTSPRRTGAPARSSR
jgi:molecular chaperone DnaK